jgi:hypothetical protein
MVNLALMVDESLARHGVEANFDPGRVQWSNWFAVDDMLALLQVPGKSGLFALAEEMMATDPCARAEGKRWLGLYQMTEAEDLGLALARLFLFPAQAKRHAGSRCFARYAVIEDGGQRKSAYAAFQRWLFSQAEAGCGLADSRLRQFTSELSPAFGSSNHEARNGPPDAFSPGS